MKKLKEELELELEFKKTPIEHIREIKEKLREKGIDVSLFTENIRDGPSNKKNESLEIQTKFWAHQESFLFLFRQAEVYRNEGYPEREIKSIITNAKAKKEGFIKWVEDKYAELTKLKEELENEKKEGKKI